MSSDPSSLLFRHPSRRLPRVELREFHNALIRRVGRGRGFTCLLADDRELRRLNREFRGKNYATDVLSFPGEIAEIAISVDRAAVQAVEHGHSLADEVRILMLHGALHLAGMDHEKDSGEMADAEARWRRKLGLPSGLIERTQA